MYCTNYRVEIGMIGCEFGAKTTVVLHQLPHIVDVIGCKFGAKTTVSLHQLPRSGWCD
ncbi:hypothetical protein HMPREF6745_0510 [Prevotella sp. oral taxon 472 str. F0295]|nr:hypothetical protein HMPREF6745_0510 [Prevotella sp. oral taxon 472 str. F0295]